MNSKTGEGTFVSGTAYETFDEYETEEGILRKNDVIAWEDPDMENMNINVGWVNEIYKKDGKENVEISTTIPAGRIELNNHVVGLSGEEIYVDRNGSAMKFIERFLSSDYAVYMACEWTRSGDIRVEGE